MNTVHNHNPPKPSFSRTSVDSGHHSSRPSSDHNKRSNFVTTSNLEYVYWVLSSSLLTHTEPSRVTCPGRIERVMLNVRIWTGESV